MTSDLNFWQTIVLAVIQGATEFLPISSSGHLVLMREWFGWSDEGGLVFDTILHAGSLTAILIYFRRTWRDISKAYFRWHNQDMVSDRRLPWLLVVATIPVIVAAPFLKHFLESETCARHSISVGISMLATGLLFWLAELRLPGNNRKLTFPRALTIGIMQIVALLPGASRSGWTTCGGMIVGQTRAQALRFSFLMAVPTIGGALVFQARDIWQAGAAIFNPLQLILGFLVSLTVSLGAIHFCLIFFKNHSLRGFGLYLLLAGLLAIII